jgi:thiol-disulfide isomerase/thioredoxin
LNILLIVVIRITVPHILRVLLLSLALLAGAFTVPVVAGGVGEAERAEEAEEGTGAEAPTVDAEISDRLENLGFVLPEGSLPVPALGFDSLSGDSIFLEEAKGSLVMLNFWASWCPPCREEMPSMQRLWESLSEDGFLLYAVSVGERRDTVESFILEEGYTFPVLLDPGGIAAEIFQVRGIPVTWLVGPDGFILGRYVGSRRWDSEEIIALFAEILEEEYYAR